MQGTWLAPVYIPILVIATYLPWYFKDEQNAEREAYQSSGVFFLISPYNSIGIFKAAPCQRWSVHMFHVGSDGQF